MSEKKFIYILFNFVYFSIFHPYFSLILFFHLFLLQVETGYFDLEATVTKFLFLKCNNIKRCDYIHTELYSH